MEKVLNLKATVETTKIVLSWEGEAKSYDVYKDGKKVTSTYYTETLIPGLKANTIYGFKIVAVYEGGETNPVSINVRTKNRF